MPIPKCPVCGSEHLLKTDPRHGGNDLTECVRRIAAKAAKLERLLALETGASLDEVVALAEARAASAAKEEASAEAARAAANPPPPAADPLPVEAVPPAPAEGAVTQTSEISPPAV